MKSRLLVALASLLAAADIGSAQAPGMGPAVSESDPAPAGTAVAPATQLVAPVVSALPDAFPDRGGRGDRFWAGADYLLWWFKSVPEPVPLATVSQNVGGASGTLADPNTAVALGGTDIRSPARHGGRLSLGYWLDTNQTVGVEASGLFIANKAVRQGFFDPGTFNSFITFTNAVTGQPFVILLGTPGFTADHVLTVSNSLHTVEVEGVFSLAGSGDTRLTLLAGARWLRMNERLDYLVTNPLLGGGLAIFTPFIQDDFATRNDFYGGQLGLRALYEGRRFSLSLTAKVALGVMNESLQVQGSSANGVTGGLAVGGVFAQRSNIGTFTRDQFAVVPEGSVNVGCRLTDGVRATIGYTFLYASDVLRPGNQIDNVVNVSQSALGFGGGGTLVGVPRPLPRLRASDFWAQGMNFGLEFRY